MRSMLLIGVLEPIKRITNYKSEPRLEKNSFFQAVLFSTSQETSSRNESLGHSRARKTFICDNIAYGTNRDN